MTPLVPPPAPDEQTAIRRAIKKIQLPLVSGATSAVVLFACLLVAGTVVFLVGMGLHLPPWIRFELVMAAWWLVWIIALARVLYHGVRVSDDGNLLTYAADVTGFREYLLHIKDLRTGELVPDNFGKVSQFVWATDNKTLFYTTEDAAKRAYRLYRHVLGGDKDELIYEEKDELYRLGLNRTRDKAYILAVSNSSTT